MPTLRSEGQALANDEVPIAITIWVGRAGADEKFALQPAQSPPIIWRELSLTSPR
jgi:hypothetical protein